MLGVEEITGQRLEVSSFLMKPTLAGLCEAARARAAQTEFEPVLALRKQGTRPPLFCLYAVNGERPPAVTRERVSEAFGFAATLPPGTMFDPTAREAQLAKLDEPRRRRFAETFGQMFSSAAPGRVESLVPPLERAFRHLHDERPETRGQQIACVGFCMGGSLSALLACEEPELCGAAVFYGMAPAAEKTARIKCPVIAFSGARDQRVNAGIPGFQEAMRAAGKPFEHYVYEGAGHAFFNDDSPSYDLKAARDSWARLLAFFSKVLSG